MAPQLFTVPGLGWEIQSYGFFMGLALVVGWVVALALARRDRLPADVLGTVYVVSVAGGVFAARGAWLLQHPEGYRDLGSLVSLSADGLAPFAGVVVALVISAVMVSRRRIPVTAWFDAVAPAFAIGTILERFGALLAGSGFGRYAPELPWSIAFPAGSPAFVDHARTLQGLMPPGADTSLAVHPTQLYGIALAAVGLGIALAVRKRRSFSGQLFMTYAIYVVVARIYIEEWFRADAVQAVFGPFNPGQVAAALLLVALVSILRTRAVRAGRQPTRLRYWEGGRWSPEDASIPSAKAPSAAAKVASGDGSTAADSATPTAAKKKKKRRG